MAATGRACNTARLDVRSNGPLSLPVCVRREFCPQPLEPTDMLTDELVCRLLSLAASCLRPSLALRLGRRYTAARRGLCSWVGWHFVLTLQFRLWSRRPRRRRATWRRAACAVSCVCHFPRWKVYRGEPIATATRLRHSIGVSPPLGRCLGGSGNLRLSLGSCCDMRGRWRHVARGVARHWSTYVRWPRSRRRWIAGAAVSAAVVVTTVVLLLGSALMITVVAMTPWWWLSGRVVCSA